MLLIGIFVLGVRDKFNLSFRLLLYFGYIFLDFILLFSNESELLLNIRDICQCVDSGQGRHISY